MASKTLNISIPEDMDGFLTENPSLSPSKIFQSAIENIQNSIKHNPQLLEANKTIAQLQKKCEKLNEFLQKATEFITIKGLWDEFQKQA